MSHRGSCLCGAVRFEAEGVNTGFHSCHCGICRKWTGGPAMAAGVERVSFSGEENIGRYASSEWAERGFCKQCGTNLFYRMTEPNLYMMWVGTFDDAASFELAGEIYVDAKPAGYAFAGDHERLTEAEFLASIGMQPEQKSQS